MAAILYRSAIQPSWLPLAMGLFAAVGAILWRLTRSRKSMEQTHVIDWRVWKAATVAADGPTGSPVRAGDVIYAITQLKAPSVGPVSFITPSPVSLALSVAIRAAKSAVAIKDSLVWTQEGEADGTRWSDAANLPKLYAYFEEAMIAATFAFQALEAYANQVIVQSLQGTMTVSRHKGDVEWNAGEIERNCTTEEKLATIIPTLGKVKSPKGTKIWEEFTKLKAVRDGTVHLKELNQYVRGTEDRQTLYFQFLTHDPLAYPRRAVAMIRYFTPPGADAWLLPAEAMLTN